MAASIIISRSDNRFPSARNHMPRNGYVLVDGGEIIAGPYAGDRKAEAIRSAYAVRFPLARIERCVVTA
jgi:hypothetical protein